MERTSPTLRLHHDRPLLDQGREASASGLLPDRFQSDALLVSRCLRSEPTAWEELYARFHDRLLVSIRALLGERADFAVVDELAARVWYSAVANGGKLLAKFDPTRGAGLTTFLRHIARDEASRYFRAERRRRSREKAACRKLLNWSPVSSSHGCWADHVVGTMEMDEFIATLTPAERQALASSLEPSDDQPDQPMPDRLRQQRHRLREKLVQFLARDG